MNALFTLVAELKVPGRKAKAYEQQFVRTMIFEKLKSDDPVFVIDGVKFEFSPGACVDLWNFKSALVNVYNTLDPE